MRITKVTTAVIEANFDWTLVRIETDDGVSGLGECFCAPGLTATVSDLAPLLEGEDPLQIEPLTQKLHLATAHASWGGTVFHAISGIEAALWDLAARSLGVPLWQLFGGQFRDRVRVYADCHAGDALTSLSSVLVSRHLPWMGPASEDEVEYHWSPRAHDDVFNPDAYRGGRARWSSAGSPLSSSISTCRCCRTRTCTRGRYPRHSWNGRSRSSRRLSRQLVRPTSPSTCTGDTRPPTLCVLPRRSSTYRCCGSGSDAAGGSGSGRRHFGSDDHSDRDRQEYLQAG